MDVQFSFASPNKLPGSVQTPIKKQKLEMSCDAKTAESPCQSKLTISDIEAEELFEDFNKIVVISE